MPIFERSNAMFTRGLRMSMPPRSPKVIFPVALCPGYKAYMRLSTRSRVDLPHPDGPISAVTALSGICIDTPFRAWVLP